MTEAKVQRFQAEVTQVLRLVVNSLYSQKDVFLRELVSNGSDALDRLRFRALQEPDLLEEGEQLRIRITPDPEARTLTIADNGIGMTEDELAQNLGTVAWSGSRDFLERLRSTQEAQQQGLQLIGQFGVGFYSGYLVADHVEVVSRAAGSEEAFCWKSDGKDSFTIEPGTREERGTSVVLHLKDDSRDLLDSGKIRSLVVRYSDYIEHPIELLIEKPAHGDQPARQEFEAVNRASALWQRKPSEVTSEQYEEFYRHLAHDWEAPLGWRHFHIEGTQMFTGLLFIPRRAPWDLFDPNASYGVRLHVQRVLVMEHADELVPRWLRFLRGVVDSEDLPLNVSREILQDSKTVKVIRQQVVHHALETLKEMSEEKPKDYEVFWSMFGVVFKESIHFEPNLKDKVAPLLRYASTAGQELVSLADYRQRMPEDQPAIYYATGVTRAVLEASPHLETLRKRGYEVLLMTDAVDPFAASALGEFGGKPLVSAMTDDLKLDGEPSGDDEKKQPEEVPEAARPLIQRFQDLLHEQVAEVRVSKRLTDSPVCLVIPEGGLAPHVERMLRSARQVDGPLSKRILEVNLEHPLIQGLQRLQQQESPESRVAEWIQVLYDQALLAEGSPVDDPSRLARQIAELLTSAVGANAAGSGE